MRLRRSRWRCSRCPLRRPRRRTWSRVMQDDNQLVYGDCRAAAARARPHEEPGRRGGAGDDAVEGDRADTGSRRKPRGFNGAKPGDYPPSAWDPYDDLVRAARGARDRGNFNPTGPGPRWAHKRTRVKAAQRAAAGRARSSSAKFVRAAGRRYSGSYRDENQGRRVLPRVDWWAIWNEPNQPGWLTPQGETKRGVGDVAAAPHIYRDLLVAGAKGLLRTGHGDDLLLIGELAPIGSAMKPKGASRVAEAGALPARDVLPRTAASGRYHGARREGARLRQARPARGPRALPAARLRPSPVHAQARAHASAQPKRDMIDISNLGELTAHARQDRSAHRAAATRDAGLPDRVRLPVAAAGPVQGRLTACCRPSTSTRATTSPGRTRASSRAPSSSCTTRRRAPSSRATPSRTGRPTRSGLFTAFPEADAKPAANAYKFPLVVRRRRGTARIWGQARFAPNGATYPIVLSVARAGLVDLGELGPRRSR